MEWTGYQQVFFFVQSVMVGAVICVGFDLVTALTQRQPHRSYLIFDVIIGPVAALLVFFGALSIMDGQLHPLLITGSFLGILAEHFTLGVWLKKFVRRVLRLFKNIRGLLLNGMRRVASRCLLRPSLLRKWGLKVRKRPKKDG